MKNIALTLLAIILIPLASIKAAPAGSGGSVVGGSSGSANGLGSRGPGGGGYMGGGDSPRSRDPTSGYRGWKPGPAQPGGGDTGPAIVVIPKPTEDPPKNPPKTTITWPAECKRDVRDCASRHVYGNAGLPRLGGPCCGKFKAAEPCVCRLLTAMDQNLSKKANRVLGACRMRRPICIKVPMPRQCRPEVRHCIEYHVLGGGGDPPFNGACCTKFRHSRSCLCSFDTSKHPKLHRAAEGILRGCRFKALRC